MMRGCLAAAVVGGGELAARIISSRAAVPIEKLRYGYLRILQ